jgi:hypothetical protein
MTPAQDHPEVGAAATPREAAPRGRDPMLDEALDMVDAARAAGVTLRLVGSLAVLAQCRDVEFCRREARDIDAVALRRQTKPLLVTMARLGFEENRHARLASAGQLVQAYRPCRHTYAGGPSHDDDRVDIYLDAFRLHHTITLRRRLEAEPYTVPAADVLLVKLQRTWSGPSDVHDVVALLKDAELRDEEAPGVIGLRYMARTAAGDWGLFHDVSRNLAAAAEGARRCGLGAADERRVLDAVQAIEQALREARKGPRWRLRALAGERLPWHDVVDENDGDRIGLLERAA